MSRSGRKSVRSSAAVVQHHDRAQPLPHVMQVIGLRERRRPRLASATRLRGRERCDRGLQGLRWTSVRRPVVVKVLATSRPWCSAARSGCHRRRTVPSSGESACGARETALAAMRLLWSRPLTCMLRVGLAEGLLAPGRSRWAAVDDRVVGPIAHLRPRAATRRDGSGAEATGARSGSLTDARVGRWSVSSAPSTEPLSRGSPRRARVRLPAAAWGRARQRHGENQEEVCWARMFPIMCVLSSNRVA